MIPFFTKHFKEPRDGEVFKHKGKKYIALRQGPHDVHGCSGCSFYIDGQCRADHRVPRCFRMESSAPSFIFEKYQERV